jgi:Flp pilus assembly protein TadG
MTPIDKIHNGYSKTPAQALVEWALLLPILLVLVLASVDLGRMFYTKIVIENATREGAYYLARHPKDKTNCLSGVCYLDTRAAVIEAGSSSGITVTSGEITFADCCTQGFPVSVTVTKTANLIFGAFLKNVGIISGTPKLTSTLKMVVQ